METITMQDVEKNAVNWLEDHNKAKKLRNKAVFAALEEAIAKKTFFDKIAEFKQIIL
jgi:hypothetical protein